MNILLFQIKLLDTDNMISYDGNASSAKERVLNGQRELSEAVPRVFPLFKNKLIGKISLIVLLLGAQLCAFSQTPAPNVPNAEELQLVFQDEFNGSSMDWSVWDSDDALRTSASGQLSYRGKENIVVADGLMKLMVKQESINGSEWTAGFVWLKETYGANTYYETRMSNTDATGINNAFWMAAKNTQEATSSSYKNRYEIDCPENRLLDNGKIQTHWAWHDWKTSAYYPGHIAQGGAISIDDDDFHTWGLWIGETRIIIYMNGDVLWDGKYDDNYPNQYETGVGKFPTWLPNEEERAYGKYGQSDWSYFGGMNGDRLNVCFSTLPWGNSNSTLSSAAHNSYMGVDYIRVYKRKKDFNTIPEQTIETIQSGVTYQLKTPINMDKDGTNYFSVLVKKEQVDDFTIVLNADTDVVSTMTLTNDNHIQLVSGADIASTSDSYPASIKSNIYFTEGKDHLVVGRITSFIDAKDIISYKVFPLEKTISDAEPFLYQNIDSKGNTNITTEWDLSHKLSASGAIKSIAFDSENGNSDFSRLKIAENYLAVVEEYRYRANCFTATNVVAPAEVVDVSIELKGTAPWKLSYKLNDMITTLSGITTSPYTFQRTINEQTTVEVLSVEDASGRGTAGDRLTIYLIENEMAALCDGVVREHQADGVFTADLLELKNTSSWNRRMLISFDISGLRSKVGGAAMRLFLNSSSATTYQSTLKLFGVNEEEFECNALDWNDALTLNLIDLESSTDVDNGDQGIYVSLDVSDYLNQCFSEGQTRMVLYLDASDASHVLYFNASENTENQPKLEYAYLNEDVLSAKISYPFFNEFDFVVYPNPTNGFFSIKNITSHHLDFSIYDLNGQIIRSGGINELQTRRVEGVSPGLYLLTSGRALHKVLVKTNINESKK